MQTTITARHCEISDGLRERTQAIVDRLGSIAPRAMESTVVFDSEGTQQTVELRLHVAWRRDPGGARRGNRPSHGARTAPKERLRRQLERASTRPRRSRPSEPNLT